MEGANLFRLAVVLTIVFTKFTKAEIPCDRGGSCAELFCDHVHPRFENISSDIRQLTQKLIDDRYEPSGTLHNSTLQALTALESHLKAELEKQGQHVQLLTEKIEENFKQLNTKCLSFTEEASSTPSRRTELNKDNVAPEYNPILKNGFLIPDKSLGVQQDNGIFSKEIWESQEKKFTDIESAIVNLQTDFASQSLNLMNRLDSVENTLFSSLPQITDRETVLKKEFQESLLQQETKQKEYFETLNRKYENSITEMRSALEAKFTTSVEQIVSEMSKALKTILTTVTLQSDGLTAAFQSHTQKFDQHVVTTREKIEKQETKMQETIDPILDVKTGIFQANQNLNKSYAQLEDSTMGVFNKLEQKLDNVTEQIETASRKLENITTQTERISQSVQNQTIQFEQYSLATLKAFAKQELNFNETSKSVSNLNYELSLTNQKLTRSCEQLSSSSVGNSEKMEVKMQNIAKQMQNISSQSENTARNQGILEKIEMALNNLTNRTAESTSKILETIFVTSPRYSNVRMVTNLTDRIPQLTFSKSLGMNTASYKCKLHCDESTRCKALNIIEKEDSFVCELLPDNLCLNQTRNALLNWPGSTLWEKISTSTGQSCLDVLFPPGKPISCEIVRPGCFGNWPDCSDCIKTCWDSHRVYAHDQNYYTLWPEEDGPFKTPIFGQCYGYKTILLRRKVNLDTAALTENYMMSFADMHCITRLGVYTEISFDFWSTSNNWYYAEYMNPNIGADGTLSGITFRDSVKMTDIFKLNDQPLKPTPFVTVTDDRYGCGSFWLVDPSNATYCPGGQVRMLGQVKIENGRVITGMSLPESYC